MASHNEAAHNWAHQTGRARKGFNMFYEGRTIYSYGHHFPIASIVDAPDGRPAVLLTTEGYSVSTAKHISYTRRAIPAELRVFHVAYVAHGVTYAREDHAGMVARFTDELAKAVRARKYGQSRLDWAERIAAEANAFADAFRLDVPTVTMPDNMDAIRAQVAARAAVERERNREQQARQEQAAREREARDAEAIAEWVAGTRDKAPHTRLPYVRVKGDQLETSWGIRVPLAEALPLFRMAQHCQRNAVEFTPSGKIMVGSWPLSHIDPDGTIRAGCHIIPLERQVAAAQLAGIEL